MSAAPEARMPAQPSPGVDGALRQASSWLRRRLLEPEPPLSAVEVRAGSLGVVRFVRHGGRLALGAAASLLLPEGTLTLSMAQSNILDPASYRKTLEAVLERAGVPRGARVGLVLPDPVARVALLPAREVLVRGRGEAEEMIRFRLRKALPFDVREARVCYQNPPDGDSDKVLVAAIFRPVLAAYEEAFRALGLDPGLVQISGLALLDRLDVGRPGDRLLVNWDEGYLSLFLSRSGWPLLVRTLTGEAARDPWQVVREAASTVLYHRERLGGSALAGASVRSAALPAPEAAALLSEPLGLTPEILDPWGPLAGAERGAATQALAGAVSCVLGRMP